jgi:rare lipoprotein A (peptidoglycan hydrolase)
MRLVRRTTVAAALLGVALPVLPAGAEPRPVGGSDVPRLTAQLERVTARAEGLRDRLSEAAAHDGGLRVAYGRVEQARLDAQRALDSRARQVYMAAAARGTHWMTAVAAPDLQQLAHRGTAEALTVDRQLIEDVTARMGELRSLQQRAQAFRRRLMAQAQPVLEAQETARTLLARATELAAQDAELQARLAVQRDVLDSVSEDVALALTPGQQARARRALAREGAVVELLERSGSGYPAGYVPSGVVLEGGASWYGPGFVGNPTASGAPYDPERLTCAHKTLPLGTVVRVSRNGLAVSCLVNDRGPYVDGRIIDMSRAGSRALGYSGVAHVVVEVLAPG